MNITGLLRRVRESYAANPYMWQFAVVLAAVYVGEGLAQQSGLIGQPLKLYLNETLNLSSTQIAMLGWVWYIPVLVKPGLGIITDYISIRGSRRKLYLLLSNAVTTIGYLFMIGAASWVTVSIAMFVTNAGLIMATAVTGGLLVENSRERGLSSRFVSLQWVFFSLAIMFASFIAGSITEHYKDTPLTALHITSAMAAVAAVGMIFMSWKFLHEEPTESPGGWKAVGAAMKAGLKEVAETRAVWLTALFIFAYFFSPGLGNPMFLYQVRELHFGQDFIGNLGSLGAAFSIVGGVLFFALKEYMTRTGLAVVSLISGALAILGAHWLLPNPSHETLTYIAGITTAVTFGTGLAVRSFDLKGLLYFSIITGTVSGLGTLWLLGPTSALVLTIVGGILSMVALIAGLSLAAEFCPKGSESFTYAVLMSCHNLCNPLSETTGGWLYDHVFSEKWAAAHHLFDGQMWTIYERLVPLIWISTAFTLLPIIIVPFLKWGKKQSNN